MDKELAEKYQFEVAELMALWAVFFTKLERDNSGKFDSHIPPGLGLFLSEMIERNLPEILNSKELQNLSGEERTNLIFISIGHFLVQFGMYLNQIGFTIDNLTPCNCLSITDEDIENLLS